MLFTLALLLSAPACHLTPARLECEAFQDPMGIDEAHPKLSWIVTGSAVGARQTAYRLRAASTKARLSHPDLWDSGRVDSANTLEIPYRGKPLNSGEKVYWSVQVWDEAGQPSVVSPAATWTMNLLSRSDWTASWIGPGPRSAQNDYVTAYLRKGFSLKRKPRRALLFVCGLGQYRLSLNGNTYTGEELSPSWTQYQKTVIDDVYDVTGRLQEGKNAIGLELGNGMYDMSGDTRGGQQPNSDGPPVAICQLRLEFADGSVEDVDSDGTWKWLPTPATYSGVFGGEDWDARKEPKEWNVATFDDANWKSVVLAESPAGHLRGIAHAGPPLRTITTRAPVQSTTPKPNVVVLDLGQNAPYVPSLTLDGPEGAQVSAWPAEQLLPDGTADQRTMRAGKHVTYTLAGGAATWRPSFWYCGSRYWQIEAKDPQGKPVDPATYLRGFKGLMVHSSAAPVGKFECSNDLLNKINSLVTWAIRSNLSHVISDCPHREKSGWLEQDHLMGPELLYTYDQRALLRKVTYDMEDAQHADGRVPTMAPEYFFYQDGFADSVEWGASAVLVPSLLRRWYGDSGTLEQAFPMMARYVDYLTTKTKDGILSNGLGDWNGGGADPRTPVALTDTAYLYALAKKVSDFALILHRWDDAHRFLALAHDTYDAFNAKFLYQATGKYATGSQSCQATAIDLGLVPSDVSFKAFDRLVDDVIAQNYAVSCGEVGHASLIRVLASHGRSDLIAKIHLQTERPGYGYQVKKGLTTLAESWDASPISLNHFMLGQILEWEYGTLVGLQPDPAHPAFERALIAPTPVPDIAWAKASYDSCRGRFDVEWHIQNGVFRLIVTVPANASAHIKLPGIKPFTVKGGPSQKVGKNELVVQSGTYTVTQTR